MWDIIQTSSRSTAFLWQRGRSSQCPVQRIVGTKKIISGAQRIHDADFLKQSAVAKGIGVKTISTYLESFKYGMPLHGGFEACLDRVVMLFCGLKNICKVSLFPRDPKRLGP
ncbi:unnamed protein product [Thlaspi arvense]|uniref:Aminoacyl-tRNA synthetase class II (D/K/N) domain-containing protein n=1 Tax=Thlaspi arvense TaxID=13288 RepID=A0AAU9RXB5_THLAR|nr:unnamed protein product [Thlaspi arvense]